MSEEETVRTLVLEALNAVNQLRPVGNRFAVADDMLVYGGGGVLDSLELVHFVVDVEQRLEEQLGAVVTLADERAVSQKRSPFRSVGSFVDFVIGRLAEGARDR